MIDKIEFLKKNKERCEGIIEYSKNRIREMEVEVAVINEIISGIEGREDNANSAQ